MPKVGTAPRVLVLGLSLLATACAPSVSADVIDLGDLQPLSAPRSTEVVPLRVAVAAVISPQGNVEAYTPLLNYIGAKLQRPVDLVQRRTYAEINQLVEDGHVDVALVCTSAYVAGAREFGMDLLVAPEVGGETAYYSLLIVPADSPAESMADLRGKVFAFTDPMSHTGRNYPTYLVQQLGDTPVSFFARTFYTYSHDDAIRAVAEGVAEGASVDNLVYEFAVAREPELGQRTRVIDRSPAFGIPPVVVGPNVRPQLRAELQSLLLGMAGDQAGRAALHAAGIDRFVLIDDSAYDSVRDLEAQVAPP